MDLNALSLKELKDLQAQVARAIASFEERKKKEALAELEDRARQMGFSLSELLGTPVARKRAPAAAKYANPENAAETWSGRGRKPRWFEAALKAGRAPEEMSV
ncbi:H-NS family nucleoid-associated regulatory protein [Gemmobacter caeruleus]|uniref:H-NS histone family protein n=1 Tax=Gemmobacter caeruleus TaxID=2595004 RepID=UPI0011ECDB8D|nr:H-NS histone family protein [Gemmobacter caeruleus]